MKWACGFGFSFQAWDGGSPEASTLHYKSTDLVAPLSTLHHPPFPAPASEEDRVEVEEVWKGSGWRGADISVLTGPGLRVSLNDQMRLVLRTGSDGKDTASFKYVKA